MVDQNIQWLEQVFEDGDDVFATVVGNEIVMLNLESDHYLSLNDVATRIWQLLVKGMTGKQIIEQLAETYEVERPRLEQDVVNLLRNMMEMGVIQIPVPRER